MTQLVFKTPRVERTESRLHAFLIARTKGGETTSHIRFIEPVVTTTADATHDVAWFQLGQGPLQPAFPSKVARIMHIMIEAARAEL